MAGVGVGIDLFVKMLVENDTQLKTIYQASRKNSSAAI